MAGTASAKVDYRDVLSADDFSLYSRLRDVRKQIADAEGVPVYAVFTNAQLAEMITRRLTSATGLAEIDGIGKARLDKHAAQFVPLLAAAFAAKRGVRWFQVHFSPRHRSRHSRPH